MRMVNNRTLKGLHAALVECIPGRAQRTRLLDALARVPGNRLISAVTAWLKAREAETSPPQRERPRDAPPKSGVFRTKVIAYTQSPPEVQVTMTKETATTLLQALETVYSQAHSADTPTGQLHRSLVRALEEKQACR